MPTLKSEFVELAAELVGDEFADFAIDAVFTQTTGWDQEAQEAAAREQTVPAIRIDYQTNQVDGDLILNGDFMLIGEYQKLAWEPKGDNTVINYEGSSLQMVKLNKDPANATFIIQARLA